MNSRSRFVCSSKNGHCNIPHISIKHFFVIWCSSMSIMQYSSILARSTNTRVSDMPASPIQIHVMLEQAVLKYRAHYQKGSVYRMKSVTTNLSAWYSIQPGRIRIINSLWASLLTRLTYRMTCSSWGVLMTRSSVISLWSSALSTWKLWNESIYKCEYAKFDRAVDKSPADPIKASFLRHLSTVRVESSL